MARSLSIPHKLRRLAQIDGRRRVRLIEAALWLVLARLLLSVVPFSRIARHLGAFVPPDDRRVAETRSRARHEHAPIAGEIGWAVTRAAGHLPVRAVCLPQAMAARIMLNCRDVPSVMHFGVTKRPGETLDAHAWLEAAGVEVIGYPMPDGSVEIACFV
jgi:hypothetical protein